MREYSFVPVPAPRRSVPGGWEGEWEVTGNAHTHSKAEVEDLEKEDWKNVEVDEEEG